MVRLVEPLSRTTKDNLTESPRISGARNGTLVNGGRKSSPSFLNKLGEVGKVWASLEMVEWK